MPGFEKMLPGMAIFRVITTTYVTARPAQAQMDPGIAQRQAFLTPGRVSRRGPDRIEMGTLKVRFNHG